MATPKSSAKQQILDIVRRQPDDSSFEEILQELAFARMTERGLVDSDADRSLTDDEILRRLSELDP